ncbi:hypothetical protein BCR39DRAFT_537075 [Naematelia encephala]|uniref:NAD-dependent epimerase/dehydratase domain-containing protein n=1 Tax=Naematelia encephala TaxID=71784 RepID=A0A1Y2AYX7_9TREE|nr:hypothetical protein BCR39DRAFT_537075 [Naematelia encephala]
MSSMRMAPLLRARPQPSRVSVTQVRYATDLVISHSPGASQKVKPIIKYGPPTGGRSAVSGHTVTVFGCTSFLGRYLVAKLGKAGVQVILPYRDEDEKRHLRVNGDLGQIVPLEWDARRPEQTYECLKHSDTVYNLVGRDWETRNYKYNDVNVDVAASIASIAAQHGTPRLIHVSHLNAAPDSPSAFYRSKYAGERAVRDAFPEATIVRPGPLYGPEDWLLNAAVRYPAFFKLNGGNTRILPVHVVDCAAALETMLTAPLTSTASTFVLPGPRPVTYNEILDIVSFFTLRKISSAPDLTKPIAKLIATVANRAIWWPTVSPDEIERRYLDDVGVDLLAAKPQEDAPSGWANTETPLGFKGVDGETAKGWADLSIIPDPIEDHAITTLRRFRKAYDYDAPTEVGGFKPPKKYHVVP